MNAARTPIAVEIGYAAVELIETRRARGLSAQQIADELGIDPYIVDETFAWSDYLYALEGAA